MIQLYHIEMLARVDVQIEASSKEEAILALRARFDKELCQDEMQGMSLPNGGKILGVKAETYEVWNELPA